MTLLRTSLASAVALALLASPAVLPAAAQNQPEVQAPTAPGASQFEESKLRSFAVAYLEVGKVAQEYQAQLQSATDPQEQQRIQTEATNNMVQAVENADGITVEEYNSIASSAQADPALAQQINTLVQEAAQAEQ